MSQRSRGRWPQMTPRFQPWQRLQLRRYDTHKEKHAHNANQPNCKSERDTIRAEKHAWNAKTTVTLGRDTTRAERMRSMMLTASKCRKGRRKYMWWLVVCSQGNSLVSLFFCAVQVWILRTVVCMSETIKPPSSIGEVYTQPACWAPGHRFGLLTPGSDSESNVCI
jgi:hypothetical protein